MAAVELAAMTAFAQRREGGPSLSETGRFAADMAMAAAAADRYPSRSRCSRLSRWLPEVNHQGSEAVRRATMNGLRRGLFGGHERAAGRRRLDRAACCCCWRCRCASAAPPQAPGRHQRPGRRSSPAVRAFGDAAEYIRRLRRWCCWPCSGRRVLIHVIGGVMLAGRIAHAQGISHTEKGSPGARWACC